MPDSMESDVQAGTESAVQADSLANPYRAPTPLEGESLTSDVEPIPHDDALRVSSGLVWARAGSLLSALAVVVPASWAALFHNGSLYEAASSWPARSVLAIPVPFVLMIVLGAHFCNRVRGKHRSLCWLATLLLFTGGLGSMASAARLVGGGQLLGLSVLFAASTFSAFLTGVALFALFYRVWAVRCASSRGGLFFEGTVLCLAIAGVVVSFGVLGPGISPESMRRMATLGLYLLVPSSCLLASGIVCLKSDWNRFVDGNLPG